MKVSLNDLELKTQRNNNEDLIYNYQSIWPIYNLSTENKKGLWNTFEVKLLNIENDLQDIEKKELDFIRTMASRVLNHIANNIFIRFNRFVCFGHYIRFLK